MTDDLIHPTPEFDEGDTESRTVLGVIVTLERFYWEHLDWYEARGFLDGHAKLNAFLEPVFEKPHGPEVAEWLRRLVDHYYVPTAIRAGISPFDELDEDARIALTSDAEIFND